MATSAFKSTTKRCSEDAAGSSNRRGPSPEPPSTSRRGRFVNPDLNEDVHSLPSKSKSKSKSRRRSPTTSTPAPSPSPSHRRSRSVSRSHPRVIPDGIRTSSSTLAPIRRSGSVSSLSRYQFSDSESHSSALTDEEARETHSNETRKTVQAVHPFKKTEHDGIETGLYEVMRQELRHAVKDIRTEIKQGIMNVGHSVLDKDDSSQSNNSDVLQAVSVIRKNYSAKLEQSEKRKHDLLAEIVAEEQRGRELSKIVQELLPDSKDTTVQEKSFGRKNNDRSWMSKCLTEDAEKYFDDFLSNVEDTDISSFDGERSDASSAIGVKKQRDLVQFGETETAGFSTRSSSLPAGMDDVVLPWLQWETSSDGSPLFYKSKVEIPLIPEDNSCDLPQGESTTSDGSNHFMSCENSRPGGSSLPSTCGDDIRRFGKHEKYICQTPDRGSSRLYFNMDEYANIECSEENIFEAWKQRRGISSGALLLCSRSCLRL